MTDKNKHTEEHKANNQKTVVVNGEEKLLLMDDEELSGLEAVVEELVESILSEIQSNKEKFQVTIKDLQDLLDKRTLSLDEERNIEFLIEYYFERDNKEDVEALLDFISEIGSHVLELIPDNFHVEKNSLIRSFFQSENIFNFDESSIYPVPVYVSSDKNDRNTIGLLVYKNGTVELFEGNDEASKETINAVNRLLNPKGKLVTVYGSHGEEIVNNIAETGKLPRNLYVSPNKEYASGFWGEDRVMFSGKVNINDISQESDVDWKIIKPTEIKSFKYV